MQTIEDILKDAGVTYVTGGQHKHVRSGWIGLDCPWCDTRNKYHLGINLKNRFASCWRCGPHSLISVVSTVLRITPAHAGRLVGSASRTHERTQESTVRGVYTVPANVGPMLKPHRQYIRSRGFDPEEIERLWDVRGIGVCRRLGWRLWMPIKYGGVPVSWTTRSICDDADSRYITAKPIEESMSPKRLLYGMDFASSTIIIVEGPIDAWRLGPGTVATLGIQYTQAQVKLMARYPIRYVCFDSSADAVRRSEALASQLSLLPGQTHVLRLDAADPGSASKKEVNVVRRIIFGE